MSSSHARLARFLAYILDASIPVPGTSVRIGLDPLIGLLPGIGDAIASMTGALILLLATQARVPKIVLMRMSLNILLNGMLGAMPVLGDLFSVWFKSNLRNADLLERHSAPLAKASTVSDWVFVLGLLLGLVLVLAGVALGVIWAVQYIWSLAQAR